jgi:Domain of unknown function (DUF222)
MDLPPAPLVPDADRAGADGAARSGQTGLRAARRATCASQAAEVRYVARIVERCRSEVQERVLELGDTQLDVDAEQFVTNLSVDTVMAALGVGRSSAEDLVSLASRLTRVMPSVLSAWSAGVLDRDRVRVLVRATEVLDDESARRVVAVALTWSGDAPWQGPAPRSWRTRVERAVVQADTEAAERRREAAVAARRVRVWAEGDSTGVLQLHADAADIALADQVVSDLARAWPATGPDGVRLSTDQRRADAMIGLFRAVRDGSLAYYPEPDPGADHCGTFPGNVAGSAFARDSGSAFAPRAGSTCGSQVGSAFGLREGTTFGAGPGRATVPDADSGVRLPRVPVRRVHDLGLVLHADTLLGDGPAADEPAQLRGLGRPSVMDPASARRLARRQLSHGSAVQVLVVDATGALQQVVRLDRRSADHCSSRRSLVAAVREAITTAPALSTDGYEPTETIARHVRAEAPTCSFYDCPRRARDCDLDHDTPWPRGPTSVTNLDPKCRRHHNTKTLELARTRLSGGPGTGTRTVHWTLPAGITVTTSPERLPGADAPRP